MSRLPRRPRPAGLTLTELLVVIGIILLVSAAALPTALVALAEREVSEAASIVQANFSLTRDRAVASGQPVGIRLIPDPDNTNPAGILASNRMVPLTPAPDYSEGLVIPVIELFTIPGRPGEFFHRLAVYEAKTDQNNLIAPPTSWYDNIRQGDTLRFEGASTAYRIVGPMTIGPTNGNSERFINKTENLRADGPPSLSLPNNNQFERLYLLNGRDDNPTSNATGSGYVDEAFDGIDNNGDGVPDPGFDGIDNNGNGLIDEPIEMIFTTLPGNPKLVAEYEDEAFPNTIFAHFTVDYTGIGIPQVVSFANPAAPAISVFDPSISRLRYTISRRPYVAPGAREIALPGGAVIDLTTTAFPFLPVGGIQERSRVPIDPFTGFVELIVSPNGQVVPSTPFGPSQALRDDFPFFYLWIADRGDLSEPNAPPPLYPRLPVSRAANPTGSRVLRGERRLVTISPKTGHASVSEITEFSLEDPTSIPGIGPVRAFDVPYLEARQFQQTGE